MHPKSLSGASMSFIVDKIHAKCYNFSVFVEDCYMILNKLSTRKNIIDSEFDFPVVGCYLIPIVYFLGNLIYLYTRFGKIYITGYYMIHYMYTYKHGFVARGLVGEVISWFYDTITEEQLADINTFFTVCLALACSLYIGRMFHIVRKDKYRFSVLFLIVLHWLQLL